MAVVHTFAAMTEDAIRDVDLARAKIQRRSRRDGRSNASGGGRPGIAGQIDEFRQRGGRQNAENHNYHHQFNQGKTALFRLHGASPVENEIGSDLIYRLDLPFHEQSGAAGSAMTGAALASAEV